MDQSERGRQLAGRLSEEMGARLVEALRNIEAEIDSDEQAGIILASASVELCAHLLGTIVSWIVSVRAKDISRADQAYDHVSTGVRDAFMALLRTELYEANVLEAALGVVRDPPSRPC